ncbi:retrovirus-related pol polyprotein from transposon TNT 1-94 [Tanacetum coccineum]|uniref:Retrovirus-related pol polyprotein from transposon TNT 1-94 n=1 Tax=Tanacetum coccineum TaxID=301880 RepID=A0ABQ5GKC9_9ASTR
MSTQQDIYAVGSENRPLMLNKENYVPWSSRLLRYANGNDDNRTKWKVNLQLHYEWFISDDHAIQTILLGLPEDIYAAVDSCKTAKEIWLRIQQMMKGSDIGIQEKKAKLFNEWERFTSINGESIESYYHHFSKLMNDFKRNKHFPEKIASNLKFLNNLQPQWSRHITIVHQTKDLHTTDYTQLYDFLKYNQKEVDELRAERLAKSQDPLALMANSNNSFKYPVLRPDLPSSNSWRKWGDQFRQYIGQNVGNQVVQNAIQNPGVQNVGNHNGVIVVSGIAHQNENGNVVVARVEGNANGNNGNQTRCYNCGGLGNLARNCTVRPRRRDAAYLQTQLLIAQKEEAGIQLQAKEFDLMATATDLDEIEEVNANCILMANLQQTSTSGTQTDKAPVYDSDGSAVEQLHDNCYNDEIFNMFTQDMEQGGGTVEQHPANVEETHVLYDSLYNNLATEVEKFNSVNRKLRETNANLTTELARYKNQERCFKINQEKYDQFERCYQQSVYQEQCLSKKVNALHLSSGKQITTLNEEISNLSKQLSKEKSTFSSLQEEKKRLKSDFKMREDELLDKQIDLENKI